MKHLPVLTSMLLWTTLSAATRRTRLVTSAFSSLAAPHHPRRPSLLVRRRCRLTGAAARRQRLFASTAADNDAPSLDEEGRRIRRAPAVVQQEEEEEDGGWENFDPTRLQEQPRQYGAGGWQDDREGWDDEDYSSTMRNTRSAPSRKPRTNNQHRSSQRDDRYNSDDRRRDDPFHRRKENSGRGSSRGRNNNRSKQDPDGADRKINLRALERAGFDHLYGLSSVLNALETAQRDLRRPEDDIDLDELSGAELEHEMKQRSRKPEAQFSPWLFVQEPKGSSTRTTTTKRSADKSAQAAKVLELAEQRGIPVATVDKGVLNVLSGDRPHQGYVLRCGKLDFETVSQLPLPSEQENAPTFWLVLDEVVDPQNFGALVRSAYFLCDKKDLGILTCSKNSAPASPVTSAASAGALECAKIVSTSNLPRTLAQAEQDGFRIVGAAANVPSDVVDVPMFELQDLPVNDVDDDNRPTLLVLGSEGHGLRSLVARSCTEFVRIPAGNTEGVDSLNVSVTGGILLWHFLSRQQKNR